MIVKSYVLTTIVIILLISLLVYFYESDSVDFTSAVSPALFWDRNPHKYWWGDSQV